ncbi:P-loop containing nucleoside triphosphate hydrolase protein [Xylaria flabelliformis]|nr:P-loop containing nucleoside triphosphate hydrolase protein [Xylaria flabelliformis]
MPRNFKGAVVYLKCAVVWRKGHQRPSIRLPNPGKTKLSACNFCLPPRQLANMPASITNILPNLLPGRGSPHDSKAFSSTTNDELEHGEPQRKRHRVHSNPPPPPSRPLGPETISLISEDEADSPVRQATGGILGVRYAGTAIPLRLEQTVQNTNAADKSSNPPLDQEACITTAGPSVVTHIDQSEESSRAPIPIKEPPLCSEQAELVDIILSGRNVFYTGSAGCGKSTVLKAFTRRLRERGLNVDIVAPTGISALGVGGSTTYVYAGWNLTSFKQSLDDLRRGAHAKYVRKRLKSTDVLVIDEISKFPLRTPQCRYARSS